jgi:hypothetical protein
VRVWFLLLRFEHDALTLRLLSMPIQPGGFHLADKLSMFERCAGGAASSAPSGPHAPYPPRQGSAPPFRARAIRDPEPSQTQAMVTDWVEPDIHLVGGYTFPGKPPQPDRSASYKQQMYEASAMALSSQLRRGKKPRGKPGVTWTIEEIMPRLKCIPMNGPGAGADEFRPQTAPAPSARPKKAAAAPVPFMTPAEFRKSLVMPDPTPADEAVEAARAPDALVGLVAVGQTPDALVSLKGRRSPPQPAASTSRQRAAGGQPALLPLPGAESASVSCSPRASSTWRPSCGGQAQAQGQQAQGQAQPAAEAAAPASEEGGAVAGPSPRQQRYEAATADLGGLVVFGNVDYSGLSAAEPERPLPAADRLGPSPEPEP